VLSQQGEKAKSLYLLYRQRAVTKMTTDKPLLTFPHPILTAIDKSPNNPSIQRLRKELYTNARAIHSTRGGGANGHLAIVMEPADYVIRTSVVFTVPTHPGDAPVHIAGATQHQITETNRQFKHDLNEFYLYISVREELKKQLLIAVPHRYLSILEDPVFGYADVTCHTMLTHLQTEYAQITNEDIELNRAKLSADWNPDDPIEELWLRIQETQRYATAANEAISDAAAIRLTLTVFERTGLFGTVTEKWRDRPDVEWTMSNFKTHFIKGNKERIRKLTAKAAGYHGANAAETPTDLDTIISRLTTLTNETDATLATAATATSSISTSNSSGPASIHTNNNITMYYCWSHGLGKNRAHTSASCSRKMEGHQDAATADNLMGGNNRIMSRAEQRPSRQAGTRTKTP
jgi:hypothetical protein